MSKRKLKNRNPAGFSVQVLKERSPDEELRPRSFGDYIGQKKIKENLEIIISAARKRGEVIDHLLFSGQPGLGKTTLAHIIVHELNANVRISSGPALQRPGDMASVLSSLEENDILFIDECHRLNSAIEEILYPVMESGKLHFTIGKGLGARMISLDLPPFTVIAATTKPHLISAPLRSRFGGVFHLDYYSLSEIEEIVERSARLMGVSIEPGAIPIIARAARFTPRLANRLLKRSRDFSEAHNMAAITAEAVLKTFELLEIDSLGLESADRRLLRIILERFKNRPVGINSLAAVLGEDKDVIEEICEPYLLKIGFLMRTPAGRMVTEEGIKHLRIQNDNAKRKDYL